MSSPLEPILRIRNPRRFFRNECYGIVVCEANAFGLPVIAADTGGVAGVVTEGENGFLLPLSARGAQYAEVAAKLYQDERRYAELVQASRAAFDSRLNWDVWGITVQKLLQELPGHTRVDKNSEQFISVTGSVNTL